MAKRIVFRGKAQADVEEFLPDAPGLDEVSVQAVCSLMSTGTENIVLNRAFDPGTHWDQWVRYPFYPGYSFVGRVTAAGGTFARGQLVACRRGHASAHVVPAGRCYPVPDGVRPEDAAWFALAKIAFLGAQAADYRLGENVMIIGAGPIGQMSVRWARLAGARDIIVIDRFAERLELAARGGATATISAPIEEARAGVLAATGGDLPARVIDTTGNPAVFAQALALVQDRGRLILLGDTGYPEQQHLTPDVLRRGLTVVGVHDSHAAPPWDEARIVGLFLEMLRQGRFAMDGMISHRFAPEDCRRAYATANEARERTMGILFDWEPAR